MKLKIGKRRQVVPNAEYLARVTEVRIESGYKGKKTICFAFEIVEGPYKGVFLSAFANGSYETFSEYSKIYRWHELATRDRLQEGDEIDLEAFTDKVLRVATETKKSKKTGNEFSNVIEILGVHCEV